MSADNFAKNILRLINEVISDGDSLHKKLDAIVKIIVQELCVDVSSVYLVSSNGKIELSATEGLSKEAVNRINFDSKEGIVGHIFTTRKSAHITNVWNNEFFLYKPETAEDPYYTMIGVPIVYKKEVFGVLSVQNRPNRPHPSDHLETLETISGIVAEFIAKNVAYYDIAPKAQIKRSKIKATFLNPGNATGRVVLHNSNKGFQFDVFCESSKLDLEFFKEVFHNSYTLLNKTEKEVITSIEVTFSFEHKICTKIKNGLMPDKAISETLDAITANLECEPMAAELLKKFSEELILGFLNKKNLVDPQSSAQNDIIVVARKITPRELLNYANFGLNGIVLERCSSKSHILVLAKSINIPLATDVNAVFDVFCRNSYITMNSDSKFIEIGDKSLKTENNNPPAKANSVCNHNFKDILPDISIYSDVNLINDAENSAKSGCFDGVGLVRTEMLFGHLPIVPNKKMQIDYYRQLFKYVSPTNCKIRFFDFSMANEFFDKQNAICGTLNTNPDLGLRGIRVLLQNKNIFQNQIRALLEASDGLDISVTLPMVSCLDEILQSKEIISSIDVSNRIKMGLFIEVPSVVYELDSLAKYVDFFQIGTNDLLQCFYGVDRNFNAYKINNLRVLTYPFLHFLQKIIDVVKNTKKQCIVSGGTTNNAISILILYLLGFRLFSIHHRDINILFEGLAKLDIAKLKSKLDECMQNKIHDIRGELEKIL